jgi:NADH-quinone oxidoreductase subunit J
MVQVAFFIGAIGAVGGALAVVALRNPFYSVLALVVHLVSLAGLFLLLYAQFIAAAQVVVYAGAVMVLYVFVAAYVGAVDEPIWEPIPGQRFLAPLLAAALFVELSIAILGTGLSALDTEGPTVHAAFGTPAEIGKLLLERFLVVFEATSMLLLVAAVGAIVLAGRSRSNHSDGSSPAAPGPSGSGAGVAAGPYAAPATSSLAPTDPPSSAGQVG